MDLVKAIMSMLLGWSVCNSKIHVFKHLVHLTCRPDFCGQEGRKLRGVCGGCLNAGSRESLY